MGGMANVHFGKYVPDDPTFVVFRDVGELRPGQRVVQVYMQSTSAICILVLYCVQTSHTKGDGQYVSTRRRCGRTVLHRIVFRQVLQVAGLHAHEVVYLGLADSQF